MLAGAATAVLIGLAAPASAGVTISPNTAVQGTGVNGDFTITNDHPSSAITTVTLTLPANHPIPEVYPLSAEDWAPRLTTRRLDPPVPGLHGSMIDQATATVVWTAMPGRALQPGKKADLRIAMGPLPEADHIVFTVQPTYADGSTGPATGNGATDFGATRVAMKLTPAVVAPLDPVDEAAITPTVQEPGTGAWAVSGWIAAAVFAAFGVVATLRARREWRHTDDPAPGAAPVGKEVQDDDGAREPAVAGPRVTSWSYRDGP
ncbi:hypothetical protein Sya03_41510 [Spirilliplanes yamanashiensis]|uniref:YncI copper-binding domain-containing protein n=1 Tax=Spirilliplanes yamanashiensis TaxID=42233 RepID=A0A8J4DL22_9ACTN|nr:hypothetical protein Sya03_41510 [Spirilliplanes yamanashiensis]